MPQDNEANAHSEALIDAIANLLSPLLNAMEALGYIGRHFHPPHLPALVASVAEVDVPLRQGLDEFRALAWPEHLGAFAARMQAAADAVCLGFDGLRAAVDAPDGTLQAYRGIRQNHRAWAALYPLADRLPPINRFFLDEAERGDAALVDKLAQAGGGREDVGVMHMDNDSGSRGGFSLYVPEYYDPGVAYPLIVALHGGRGHGRDFLWTWLRQARGRGAILISPSSLDGTWSLMNPDGDSANITRMLAGAQARWNIDPTRLLLTGMSDGGTFTYVSGLQGASPFTHLAPVSASFHPLLVQAMDPGRLRGLPVYLTHGVLDWMFPIAIARDAKTALTDAGAALRYREIADLSHTYPSDENPRIMDWFLG